jgi:hypothetical protein
MGRSKIRPLTPDPPYDARLRPGEREPTTYHEIASRDADAEFGGRGGAPISEGYPAAASPWAAPAILNGPAFTGEAIDAMPAVGTIAEQERAAQILRDQPAAAIAEAAAIAALSDAALQEELAALTKFVVGIGATHTKWDATTEAANQRRLALEAELGRRQARTAVITRVLGEMDDDEVRREMARCDLEMRRMGEWSPRMDDLQARRDACEAELRRRRDRAQRRF